MPQITKNFTASTGLTVKTASSLAGLPNIGRGEDIHLVTRFDLLPHPARGTKRAEGRATVTTVFARNTVCMVALPKLGLTPQNR